jgi:hypothetical protein
VRFRFAAVTVQLSAHNGYTMNLCGLGSPGAGLTEKGAGQINSTPRKIHTTRRGFGVSIRAGFRVRD